MCHCELQQETTVNTDSSTVTAPTDPQPLELSVPAVHFHPSNMKVSSDLMQSVSFQDFVQVQLPLF